MLSEFLGLLKCDVEELFSVYIILLLISSQSSRIVVFPGSDLSGTSGGVLKNR